MSLRAILFAVVCAALPTAAAQTTWYVDDDAPSDPGPGDTAVSDPAEDGTAGHPFDAIQEALDLALAGDTVLVRDGTYTGLGNRDLTFAGKDLTLVSENGPETCLIDVEYTDYSRAINFVSGETSAARLEGFTLMHGRPRYDDSETVTIGLAWGGAIYCENSSPTIAGCIIRDNSAFIRGDDLFGAVGSDGDGGGAYFANSSAELIDCDFHDNAVANNVTRASLGSNPRGGALFADNSNLVLHDCRFFDNLPTGGLDGGIGGGAIAATNGSTLTMFDCIVRDNRAGDGGLGGTIQTPAGGEGSHGGGISVAGSTLNLHRCTITGNTAGRGYDGADQGYHGENGGAGGGIYLLNSSATLIDCFLADNTGGRGGDPAFPFGGEDVFSGDGGDGGGICAQDASVTLINTVLAGNTAGRAGDISGNPQFVSGTNGRGGGVAARGTSTLDAINCTIVTNSLDLEGATPPETSGGIFANQTVAVTLANTILRDNLPQQFNLLDTATLTATYSNIDGGLAGTGNIDADPLFFDADGFDDDPTTGTDGNYRPIFGAPGNDAGDNSTIPASVTTDADGGARQADDPNAPDTGNGTAPLVDMGAYEANNGQPAGCDMPYDPNNDCDGNGVNDGCDVLGPANDCNGNGIPDSCDIASGAADDCNGNGIPDACEFAGPLDGFTVELGDPGLAAHYVVIDDGTAYGISSGGITLEAWVYPYGVTSPQSIINKRNGNYVLQIFDGRVRFRYTSGSSTYNFETATAVVRTNAWTHVAVTHTFGTSTTTIYINGTPVGATWQSPPSGNPSASSNELYIGRVPTAAQYRGLIDEVRIWTVARTPMQISNNLYSTVSPAKPNLLAYFRFDEGAGLTTRELVQDIDADLNDAAPWVATNGCAGCPGDADNNGGVDLDDLAIVLGNFGAAAPPAAGDLDGDGFVGLGDLAEVLANFGSVCN